MILCVPNYKRIYFTVVQLLKNNSLRLNSQKNDVARCHGARRADISRDLTRKNKEENYENIQ